MKSNNKKLLKRDVGATFKDGGTKTFKDKEGKKYFIDYRIGSKTKGKLFDKYPGDKDAKQLDLKDFTFLKKKTVYIPVEYDGDEYSSSAGYGGWGHDE